MRENTSINLNTRDITDSVEESRFIRSILGRGPAADSRFAVLELSTKAVKLLIGKNDEAIRANLNAVGTGEPAVRFDFGNFFRLSDKVEAGRGLDARNVMNMDYFTTRVLGSILAKKQVLLDRGIDTLYTVATAAYRTAANREEILDLIRERARINVRVLTKEEEANATLFAYRFTSARRMQLLQSPRVVMIDQGGGSTEISVFSQGCCEIVGKYSINLGTTALRNFLFRDSCADTPLEQALRNSDRKIKERLVTFYKNMDKSMIADGEMFCVAVGTAITTAAGKGGTAKQHDKILTRDFIQERIAKAEAFIRERVETVGELDAALERLGQNDPFDNELTVRLGLPMYVALMEKYGIQEIHISGTGLWYGIYLQRLFGWLKED